MSVEENRAIAQQLHDARARRDLAFMEAHPAFGAESRAFFQALWTAFPDLREEVQTTVAEGEWVTQRMTVSGTQQGPFEGMPATGKRASWPVLTLIRVVNGKIVESYGAGNRLDILRQLDLWPGAGGQAQGQG